MAPILEGTNVHDSLTALVEANGLAAVVDALGQIAYRKGPMSPGTPAGKGWRAAGRILGKTAAKIHRCELDQEERV
jgi:hypothetical protein